MRSVAVGSPHFATYLLPGDKPSHTHELLTRVGFASSHRLIQLVSERPEPGAPFDRLPEPRRADGRRARAAIADFMGKQFFGRQSESFRLEAAAATIDADSLGLYSVEERGRIHAAVMLSDVGGILGIYNLCVASALRGRGLGSGLLSWVLAQARETGRPVTLQCDPKLEAWYNYLGLVSSGLVEVYSLPKSEVDDIIL